MKELDNKNNKLTLDYVFSGVAMMRLLPRKGKGEDAHLNYTPEYTDARVAVTAGGIQLIKDRCSEQHPHYNIKHSLLYNAYDEPQVGVRFRERNMMNFDNLYADSGGLQAVTRGLTIDDTFKKEIYQKQSLSDYAFCFDEIPVEFKEACISAEFARTNVDSKHFVAKDFKRCAYKTAENINEQVHYMESTNTKTFYIVQGNTFEEMHDWVRWGAEKIDDMSLIKGLAPSGACIGNGALETCDMMMACKLIYNDFPDIPKRMHLLGVGSATRMYPAINLMQNGFINNATLSFDSSTHPGCMMLGKFFDKNGFQINKTDKKADRKSFNLFLDFFNDYFKSIVPEFDRDEFLNYLLEDRRCKNVDRIEKEMFTVLPKYIPIAGCIVPLYGTWLNIGFFNRIDFMNNDAVIQQSPLGLLDEVKTAEDYILWRREFKHLVKSGRMDRKSEIDLESLFG